MCGCDQFIEDIEEEEIKLLSPEQSAELNVGEVLFWWDEIEDADRYDFQLVRPSFAQVDQFVVDTTLQHVDSLHTVINRLELTLSPGIYEWRVRGRNFGYETNFQSRSFRIN